MKRSLLSIVFCLFLFSYLQSQSRSDFLESVEVAFYEESFMEVLDLCDQIEASYPDYKNHLFFKSVAEHLTVKRGDDMKDLLAFGQTRGKIDPFYNYWLGRVHMLRYEFDEAVRRFSAFQNTESYKSKTLVREVIDLLDWIELARGYYENPDDYEISVLPDGINSSYDEISPAFFSGYDELVFSSNRDYAVAENSDEVFFSVYHAMKNEDNWSPPSQLTDLGKFPFENSKLEIVDATNHLFMYKDDRGGDIYVSSYSSDGWSLPIEFNTNIKKKQIHSHFFINDAEDRIIFASGDKNNHDLYFTFLEDGKWSTGTPLPGMINSQNDDDGPFLSHSGKVLYFSSNRRESMGGYDIFRSTWNSNLSEWNKPENMGFPINTMDDEIHFEVTPSDQSGYFSSNRLHSRGGYDIYFFHKFDKIEITGVITDRSTKKPIPNALIKFHPLTYEDEAFVATSDQFGTYTTKIFNREKFRIEVVLASKTVYEQDYESYVPVDWPVLNLDIVFDKPKKNTAEDYSKLYTGSAEAKSVEIEMIGNKFRSGQKAILNNIYFESESFQLTRESKAVLDRVYNTLINSPRLKIEIAGHTDNVGNQEANLQLSEYRAKAVMQNLIDRGIKANRLRAKGYGERFPLASNDDEINGRELNRRIEIIAID